MVEPLIINETEFTPGICFDPASNRFEVTGSSRPENVSRFYDPVVAWLNKYQELLLQGKATAPSGGIVFSFRLEYFNSSTAKYIMDILMALDRIHEDGGKITIQWFYDERDEDMHESGEEFSKLLNVPVQLESYKGS